MSKNKHIGIIGGGIAGLTAGIMLQNKGYKVSVFEASENIRGIGAGIGLAANAMKAFEYLNLAEELKKQSNLLKDFTIYNAKGKILFSVDTNRISKNFQTENYAIHRADLHEFLVEKLGKDKIFTGKKLKSFKLIGNQVNLKFKDKTQLKVDFVIGADGVNSKVRQILLPESKPKYAGYWCWRGVVNYQKEDFNKSQAIWGAKGRFGITPLGKQKVYWFACINSKINGKTTKFELSDLQNQFKNYPAPVSELLTLSDKNKIISGPIMDINPISQFKFAKILLIGDAAHATTPNMGQGACMAIEDVAVLQEELENNDLKTASLNFEKRRISRTKYIIKNSRRAGKIAQTDQQLLIAIRNNLFKILPEKITQLPLKRLYEEDFMEN